MCGYTYAMQHFRSFAELDKEEYYSLVGHNKKFSILAFWNGVIILKTGAL